MLWGGNQGRRLDRIEYANLQFELFHTCFIRCDCGTFHTNGVLEDGFRGFYRDTIVRGIPMLQTKVVVLDIEVQVRKNQLLERPVSTMETSENVLVPCCKSRLGEVIDVSWQRTSSRILWVAA